MILAYEARKITEDSKLFKEVAEQLEYSVRNAATNGFYNVNTAVCKHVDSDMVDRLEKFLQSAGYIVKIRKYPNSITIELEWEV